jgi:hypothetical protein
MPTQGGEVMAEIDNLEFWNIVGERIKPTDVKIGDVIRIEIGQRREIRVVVDAWDSPGKGRQLKLREPFEGEKLGEPSVTVVIALS